jgi:hypothetical protein
MAKLKFDNALKPVKPKFDYEAAGIKYFGDFSKFDKMANKTLDSYEKDPKRNYRIKSYETPYMKYDRFLAFDPESNKFIAVDNTQGEFWMEEFDSEEEAQNYLMSDTGTGEDFKK